MTRFATAAVLVLASLLGLSCESSKESKPEPYPVPKVETTGEVIAKIGPVTLTTDEIEKRIQAQSPFVRIQLKDAAQKKKFVDNEIRIELLAQEGWRRGLAEDPRIIAELRRAIVQRVMRDEMAAMTKELDLSDQELRAGFDQKAAEYNKPETIRLAQIVLPKDQKKQAETILQKLLDAQKRHDETAFADHARKSSTDAATRNGGGELPFMTREEVATKFGQASADRWFNEEVGVVAMEETADAIYLIKKTGKRRGVQKTLEMVKPQLRSQLLADKKTKAFDSYIEELKKKSGVTVNEGAIEQIEVRMDVPTRTGTAAATAEPEEEE